MKPSAYGGSVVDNVFSGWTSDGLEFDQDTGSPILTGYVCYGTWIKVGDHKYALTHPYFDYNAGTITAPKFARIRLPLMSVSTSKPWALSRAVTCLTTVSKWRHDGFCNVIAHGSVLSHHAHQTPE